MAIGYQVCAAKESGDCGTQLAFQENQDVIARLLLGLCQTGLTFMLAA